MYIFRLWFKDQRELIAREEMQDALNEELAKRPERQHHVVRAVFESYVPVVAHNIHPLVILRLRPKYGQRFNWNRPLIVVLFLFGFGVLGFNVYSGLTGYLEPWVALIGGAASLFCLWLTCLGTKEEWNPQSDNG